MGVLLKKECRDDVAEVSRRLRADADDFGQSMTHVLATPSMVVTTDFLVGLIQGGVDSGGESFLFLSNAKIMSRETTPTLMALSATLNAGQ